VTRRATDFSRYPNQIFANRPFLAYNRNMRRISSVLLILILFPLFTLSSADIPMEEGIASWYTSDPDGPLTANGERFDPEALNAAHKSLPFGTIVRVHDQTNGKQVEVRINDRGPYVEGRIIDLTPAAARKIDMYERGISPVKLELIHSPPIPESQYNRPGDTGWYKFQIGTFTNTKAVYDMYLKFLELGFKPSVEIVQHTMLRLSLRWIGEDQKEESLSLLKSLGYGEILIKGDLPPQ